MPLKTYKLENIHRSILSIIDENIVYTLLNKSGVNLNKKNVRLRNNFMVNSKIRDDDGVIKLDSEERCDVNIKYNFNKNNIKYNTSNFYNTYVSSGGLFMMRDVDILVKDTSRHITLFSRKEPMSTTYEFQLYFSSLDKATNIYTYLSQLYPSSDTTYSENRRDFTYELPKKLINDIEVLLKLNKENITLNDIKNYLNETISSTTSLRFIVNHDSNGDPISISASNFYINILSNLEIAEDDVETIEDNTHKAIFFKISFNFSIQFDRPGDMHLYFSSVIHNKPIPYTLPNPINKNTIRQNIPIKEHNLAGQIYDILNVINSKRKVVYYPYFEDFYPSDKKRNIAYNPFLITPLLLEEEDGVWVSDIDLDNQKFNFHNESLSLNKTYELTLNRTLKKILKEHVKKDLLFTNSKGGGLFNITFFKNGESANIAHIESILNKDDLVFKIQDIDSNAPNHRWHFVLSDIQDLKYVNLKYINLILKYYYYFYKLIKKYDKNLLEPQSNILSFMKINLLKCRDEVFEILNELLKCEFITVDDVTNLEGLSYIDFTYYLFCNDDSTGTINIWFRFINEVLKRHINKSLTCIDITPILTNDLKLDLTRISKDENTGLTKTLITKLIECLNMNSDREITEKTLLNSLKDKTCATVKEIVEVVMNMSNLTEKQILSCLIKIIETIDYIEIIDNYGIKPINENPNNKTSFNLSMLITDFDSKTRIERLVRYFE